MHSYAEQIFDLSLVSEDVREKALSSVARVRAPRTRRAKKIAAILQAANKEVAVK